MQPSSVDLAYKPRRINKAIELWEDGQAVYYTGSGVNPGGYLAIVEVDRARSPMTISTASGRFAGPSVTVP